MTIIFTIAIAISILVFFISFALQRLKKYETKILFDAVNQAQIAAITINRNNKVSYVSKTFCDILNLPVNYGVGHSPIVFFNKKDYSLVLNALNMLDKKQEAITLEFSITKNDTIKHISCRFCCVKSKISGRNHKAIIVQDRTNIYNTIHKLTESKKQLKHITELFKSSFEDSFLPSVIINDSGLIKNYNKSFYSLLEIHDKSLMQENLFEILQLNKQLFDNSLKQNKCFERPCKVGSKTKDLVFNIHPINHSDNMSFILCQIQDITRQKQSESIRKSLTINKD